MAQRLPWYGAPSFVVRVLPMNLTKSAFAKFAKGQFRAGLEKLQSDSFWQDSDRSLDGPFFIGFPRSGWGEGLLLASLLKRHAVHCNRRIPVFVVPQVFTILRKDKFFYPTVVKCYEEARRKGARSPMAIIDAALMGDLASKPFHPVDVGTPRRPEQRTVGVAWASVDSNGCIPRKTVPIKNFSEILDQVDARVISFQRRMEGAGLDHGIPPIWEVPLSSTDLDCDQRKVLNQLLKLDCMVTISTTTAHMAASVGLPTILLTARRKSHQWFWLAQADYNVSLYPSVEVLVGGEEGDKRWWEQAIQDARRLVKQRLRDL